MSKQISITMLVLLLLGFVAIQPAQPANVTDAELLTTIEVGQAVQIGNIWVPADQFTIDFMRASQNDSAPLPVNIGGISIP